jgi:amino acid permease
MVQNHSFGISLEKASVAFSVYVFSLMAAFSWNNAVQSVIQTHENKWARWVYALGITIFAIIIITLAFHFMDSGDNNSQKNTQAQRKPVVGRMETR